jgi:predicted secreted protein
MGVNWSKTSDLKPDNIKNERYNILNDLFDDKMIKKFNVRRWTYYKRFNKIIDDPRELKNFMHTLKKISESREQKDKIYKKIVKLHDILSKVDINSENYSQNKKNKLEELNKRILSILENKTNNNIDSGKISQKNEALKDITDKFVGGASTKYLDDYSDKLEKISDNNNTSDSTKISKYKTVLNDIETIVNPTKTLNITREDKILFIIITFIIRLICIKLVEWSVNMNYSNNFINSYILYTIIYLIILFIILCIVNITYNYNINSVIYGNTGFSTLANSLYYFYIIPGASFSRNNRLFIHSILLIIFSLIPIGLKSNNDDNEIDYDYTEKRKTINLISNYTFAVWIFTSIIATNY